MHNDGSTLVQDLQGIADGPLHLGSVVQAVDEDEIESKLVLREEFIGCHLVGGVPLAIRVNSDLDLASDRIEVVFSGALADLQVGLIVVPCPDDIDDIGSGLGGLTTSSSGPMPAGGQHRKLSFQVSGSSGSEICRHCIPFKVPAVCHWKP